MLAACWNLSSPGTATGAEPIHARNLVAVGAQHVDHLLAHALQQQQVLLNCIQHGSDLSLVRLQVVGHKSALTNMDRHVIVVGTEKMIGTCVPCSAVALRGVRACL